jgi:hypothetical protein
MERRIVMREVWLTIGIMGLPDISSVYAVEMDKEGMAVNGMIRSIVCCDWFDVAVFACPVHG